MQIHFFLMQNRQGKTRMAKYYSAFEMDERQQLEVRLIPRLAFLLIP